MNSRKCMLAIGFCAIALASPISSRAEKLEGSIPVKNVKEENYPGLARATLAEALAVAQQQRKGEKAVEAKLSESDDFLVYKVKMVNKENKVAMVVLDAGNLAVMKTKEKNGTHED